MKRAACYDVPVWHEMLWTENGKPCELGDQRAAGFSDGYQPELFHSLYAETPAEIPADKRDRAAAMRAKLHELAGQLPEYSTLRKSTVRDVQWASMAAQTLSESVAAALPHAKANPPDADRAQRVLAGLSWLESAGIGLGDEVSAAEGKAAGVAFAVAEQASNVDESVLRMALRRGIEAAHQQVDEAQAACDAFGVGDGNPAAAMQVAKVVRNSSKLKRIVELAGRLQSTARAKRATKSEYARSELVGVEQTGDVGRLLPSELGALSHPLRTADLVRRLGERSALGYQVRGKEKTAKGPILIALDISGSMQDGDKEVWSKAVALAVMDIARHEKRAFGVCLFNSDVVTSALVEDVSKLEPTALLALLQEGPRGGTSFDRPMSWMLGRIADASGRRAFKRADVILVTDGEADIDRAATTKKAAEDLGVHSFGISIASYTTGPLKAWVHDVAKIDDVNNDTKATDLLFEGL